MRIGRWMTSCSEAWAEDLGIWEKAMRWVLASEDEGWLSELGEARRICALRASRVGWVESWRCKSSRHWKIVSLSLSSCRITLNSKVIKFRTWTNFVNVVYFKFPMSLSHIRISGYVTYRVCSFISSHLNVAWDPTYNCFFTIWHWV